MKVREVEILAELMQTIAYNTLQQHIHSADGPFCVARHREKKFAVQEAKDLLCDHDAEWALNRQDNES